MADSLWMRLREIPWGKYPTATPSKKTIPKILENLASRKESRAMKASHELWQALCTGGVSPAARPCLPFLVEILTISGAAVQSEILDLLIRFSKEDELKVFLKKQCLHIRANIRSKDEIVQGKIAELLENIS